MITEELKVRFDAALDELFNLDQESLDDLCYRFKIEVYKTEYKAALPAVEKGKYSPAQYRDIVVKHLNAIPKDFYYDGHSYNHNFVKKTYLFNHKNHQVNKLKQKINLDLLLAGSGRNKGYLDLMAKIIYAVEAAKG
jgi:hypothetical protein